MANRGQAFGMSAKVAAKIAGKRDMEKEAEAAEWISTIIGEPVQGSFEDWARNGVVLCKLMNKLLPGSVKKITESGGDFKMMENITNFQTAAKKYGVPEIDCFQTVDLWEKRNIAQVQQCIFAVGRQGQTKPGYNFPIIGPKMSEENKREFTAEQLRAGEGHVGLQAGQNKGATQAGQNFGAQRHM
ncbi:PREDICTED: muscle-specific protein 20-like [Priapulus caudatus]|uniref:Muscle-specific protein 20-like n=1 Tax=Priapulus caudatus TaxID=37621 RepID=A0ABM1EU16_PRICU|nr:PREDICTED: muscle-specific protein 20-like [Priapulus caudatus]